MKTQIKPYLPLIAWIGALIIIGSLIGSLTKPDIDLWYRTLHRSCLTPPNFVFPVVWSILYILIAISGWAIWNGPPVPHLRLIKALYALQLVLNWSWSIIFFRYHLTGTALVVLALMDATVAAIIYLCNRRIRTAYYFMMPYLFWIVFATYLNFYIWYHN